MPHLWSRSRTIFPLLCLASWVSAQDYEIVVDRPPVTKPGTQFRIACSEREKNSSVTKLDEKVTGQEATTITTELKADAVVVNKDRLELTILNLSRTGGERTLVLLKPGEIVAATRNDNRTTYALKDGSKLPLTAEEALTKLLPKGKGKKDSEHKWTQALNIKGRKKIGDEWPMDAEIIAKEMLDSFPDIKIQNASGSAQLAAVEKHHDTECLRLIADFQIKNVIGRDFPAEFNKKSSALHFQLTLLLPLDKNLPAQGWSMQMKLSLKAAADIEGHKLLMDILTETNEEATLEFKK